MALGELRQGKSLYYVASEYPVVYCKHYVGLSEFQRIMMRPDISDKCEYKRDDDVSVNYMDSILHASNLLDFK